MISIRYCIREASTIASAVVLSLVFTPVVAFADSSQECTPPAATTGVNRPVGADAPMYSYNCNTGLWESAHYIYNPSTGLTSPKDQVVYTCNPGGGSYSVTNWVYNAPTASYVPLTSTVSQPPAGSSVIPCPIPQPVTQTTNGTSGSTGSTNNTVNNNASVSNTTNSTVLNNLNSTASTGSAFVLNNTTGGSASSGNAAIIANEINMLQSSGNFGIGGTPITFITDINGDVNGDFLLDPAKIGTIQPTAQSTVVNNNADINNTSNASIANNLTLDAASGDATVGSNTSAGDATTGNADAVANVVNVINSAIASGQSFMGIININGNLNGDILLPPNFVDQLIASNVPTVTITAPDSLNAGDTGITNTAKVNNNSTQSIVNNVNATANSGSAAVTNNTSAGSATTGSGKTNITAFNLTGSNTIGNNALLVFVNVLGQWVGLIVNAPAGATAAGLGGGITTNTANNTLYLNNTDNQQITNNIDVSARTGNALVDSNTSAGSARSGNANAAVNLLNIEGSNLSLANWFGILFINVFGSWNGSFGINTSAGDPIPPAGGSGTFVAFSFVPSGGRGAGSYAFVPYSSSSAQSASTNGPGPTAVLAAKHFSGPHIPPAGAIGATHTSFPIIPGLIALLAAVAIFGDAVYNRRRATQEA